MKGMAARPLNELFPGREQLGEEAFGARVFKTNSRTRLGDALERLDGNGRSTGGSNCRSDKRLGGIGRKCGVGKGEHPQEVTLGVALPEVSELVADRGAEDPVFKR